MREAGYEVGVTDQDAPRLKDVGYDVFLEPDDRSSRSAAPACTRILTPGHTAGSMCFLVEGSPDPVQRRHAVPRRPRQHHVRGRRLPHDHPVDRASAVRPARRHHRAARPRRRHDHRHRAPAPPGVDRPGLVTVALPADQRPIDDTPVHTDRPAAHADPGPQHPGHGLGRGAARAARRSAHDLPGRPVATYKRRIGRWLLWRAGPATGADARYLAVDAADLARQHAFRLFPDGSGDGAGPERRPPPAASGPGRKTSGTTS